MHEDLGQLLTAALVLLPPEQASRNRHPELHERPAGREARRRAARVRLTLRHLSGGDGRVHGLTVQAADPASGPTLRIHYEIRRISLHRGVTLAPLDAAVLRVALARHGVRLLPGLLVCTEADRALVEGLLWAFERTRAASMEARGG